MDKSPAIITEKIIRQNRICQYMECFKEKNEKTGCSYECLVKFCGMKFIAKSYAIYHLRTVHRAEHAAINHMKNKFGCKKIESGIARRKSV